MSQEISASVGKGGMNVPGDVVIVQELLNRVPPDQGGPETTLAVDGKVGNKTIAAIERFQRIALGFNWPDGRVDVGGKTLAKLLALANALLPVGGSTGGGAGAAPLPVDLLRQAITTVAANEQNVFGAGIHARSAGGKDPQTGRTFRQGYDRLLEYFRLAAPDANKPGSTYFGDDNVRYLQAPGKLAPLPHWCGIFALWTVKLALTPAGIQAGTWIMGQGLDRTYFATTAHPRKGDIAYKDQPFQHHAVILDVSIDNSGQTVLETIDGNSGTTSTITRNIKPLSGWDLFLSHRSLAS